MKILPILTFPVTLLIASLTLSACGGGGGGTTAVAAPAVAMPATPTVPASTTPTSPTIPTVPATPSAPVIVNATDPYTGQPASGSSTTMVSGMVVSNVTNGAVVTAYAILADGSNGAVLGISAPTGPDGKFSMQLASVATGMVRFIAQGGAFTSEADGSIQANTSLELVTPYITSELDFFVVTPATHIVSHLVSYKAKSGSSLAAAFTSGVNTLLTLTMQNSLLKSDLRAGINILKAVPGSSDDTLNTYQDLLTAIEWFGVRYDLPSNVVIRILASYAEQGFPVTGIDGTNVAINVGKWTNSKFDETVPFTLDELTAIRNVDGSLILAENGGILHEYAKSTISTELIQYFYRVKACTDETAKAGLFLRYPDDANIFADATLGALICDTDVKQIAALKARILTNSRSK